MSTFLKLAAAVAALMLVTGAASAQQYATYNDAYADLNNTAQREARAGMADLDAMQQTDQSDAAICPYLGSARQHFYAANDALVSLIAYARQEPNSGIEAQAVKTQNMVVDYIDHINPVYENHCKPA